MDNELERIRTQQRAAWNKFSGGWKKWENKSLEFLTPIGQLIIQALQLHAKDHVLDIAGGTGGFALSMLPFTDKGNITMMDLAEEMVAIASARAAELNCSNFRALVGDACTIPFPEATFDAISCRFGFMFFPDMQLAAHEMMRVLKPGGKLAVAVWDKPEKNPWATVIVDAISKEVELAPQSPDAPGIFRCAHPGVMENLLTNAGFTKIERIPAPSVMVCSSGEEYWQMQVEVGPPIAAVLKKVSGVLQRKIRQDTIDFLNKKFSKRKIELEANALVYYGEKKIKGSCK